MLSLVGALASTESFQANFESFLLLVLYFFIPWTAVNLVDYFIVRHGHYAIAEIFKPHGIYGRWGWRGIVSYLVGFVAMIAVLQHRHVLHRLGGRTPPRAPTSRCSSGCRSPGVLYWVLCRNIDVDAEQRLAEEEADELEARGRPARASRDRHEPC